MLYRQLGNTGLKVSEIGLGCASFWGKKSFDEKAAIRVVHEAIDQGVTFFDTGASYSGGNAEPRLGKALACASRKNDLVISTKAGTRIGSFGRLYKDFSPSWIGQSVEDSLKRLGLDSIPVLHLHGPQVKDLTSDLLSALERLRCEGKVQHFSINSFDMDVIDHMLTVPVFGAAMIDYNILRSQRHEIIKRLTEKKMGVFAGMALAGRLYSPSIFHIRGVRDAWYALRALKNHRKDIIRGAHFRFIEHHASLSAAQIAMAWVLDNANVSCAVFGTTRASNLKDVTGASGMRLDGLLMEQIRQAQQK